MPRANQMYNLQDECVHFDPLCQPTVTAGRDHWFRTCPSVRPHFSNLAKQNKMKTIFATGEAVGLSEWIIDDTYLVLFASGGKLSLAT